MVCDPAMLVWNVCMCGMFWILDIFAASNSAPVSVWLWTILKECFRLISLADFHEAHKIRVWSGNSGNFIDFTGIIRILLGASRSVRGAIRVILWPIFDNSSIWVWTDLLTPLEEGNLSSKTIAIDRDLMGISIPDVNNNFLGLWMCYYYFILAMMDYFDPIN